MYKYTRTGISFYTYTTYNHYTSRSTMLYLAQRYSLLDYDHNVFLTKQASFYQKHKSDEKQLPEFPLNRKSYLFLFASFVQPIPESYV